MRYAALAFLATLWLPAAPASAQADTPEQEAERRRNHRGTRGSRPRRERGRGIVGDVRGSRYATPTS